MNTSSPSGRSIVTGFVLATLGLAGCADLAVEGGTPGEQDAIVTTNGLASINGLAVHNGLASLNGLAIHNGLAVHNGLSSTEGLMTTVDGRNTISYLVRCALPAGHQITKQDQNNNWYTFKGALGVAPSWETGECDLTCQQAVSACMMAHINTAGVHIPLWIDSPLTAIGWGLNPQYPNREGTFFGNIFTPNSAGNIEAFYCNGMGWNKDVVPGRLGANQQGAPYTNPYLSAANPNGYCLPCASSRPDGPDSCPANGTTFATPITVWRGQAFQAELATTKGGTVVNCPSCSGGKRLSNITTPTTISGIFSATTGSHSVIVYYTNGDSVAHNLQVNVYCSGTTSSGNNLSRTSGSGAWFPPTGGWDKVGSVQLSQSGFLAGNNNWMTLSPVNNGRGPDLDWVEVE
jgi:hypothetical protein